MRSENFIAFFTVCGFFIGLIFSIVKFEDVENIVFYTLAITLCFYLFIHVVLILFLDVVDKKISFFDKAKIEKVTKLQIEEIKQREDKITAMLKSIHGEDNAKEGA